MRERDRWGSEWLRERGRLLQREREREMEGVREMCQNCMPTMSVNTMCYVYFVVLNVLESSSENFVARHHFAKISNENNLLRISNLNI